MKTISEILKPLNEGFWPHGEIPVMDFKYIEKQLISSSKSFGFIDKVKVKKIFKIDKADGFFNVLADVWEDGDKSEAEFKVQVQIKITSKGVFVEYNLDEDYQN